MTAKRPSHTPSLKDVRTQVVKKVIDREAERLAKQEAESLLALLKQGKPLKEAAAERNWTLAETGFFKTGADVPKLGASRELSAAVFQLTEKKPFPDRAFHLDGKYVVLELKERTRADERDFAAQKENIRSALLQARKTDAVQSWIEGSKTAMIKEGRLKIHKDVKEL